jgi:DNA polymerase III alpha subunit
VHAAGVVISPQPLTELVPLYKTNRDEIVTQFDMSGLEKLGLLKMDFLGLTTLTLIQDALRLIQKRHGVEVVPEDLPLDDKATYEIFSKGFTSGVFQFESSGMRDILRRYQPSRIEDLTALNALYRPGPIQGGMIDDFIERKWGRRAVQYDLPELKELLEETYGVIVYQEQVMQISNRLAGYSLGEADVLRRAMGKKKARRDGQAARAFHPGRAGARIPAEEGREDLRPDGAVRGIRVQQIAFGGLCLPGLRDGVPEGALPGGLHGGAAHLGNGEHGQGGEVHQRVPRDGHHDSAAGREPLGLELHARRAGRASASGWER